MNGDYRKGRYLGTFNTRPGSFDIFKISGKDQRFVGTFSGGKPRDVVQSEADMRIIVDGFAAQCSDSPTDA
ncbi:hypothetical protein [uncultured Tateyamaria sp.]|uniref:hypothetical protein n=1 Tax=uncultured Tateyamaria sp. TaxID=455651 RepID=UPI002629892A|nr:hypothetical protein [uncultured Tateyamaria sp.]